VDDLVEGGVVVGGLDGGGGPVDGGAQVPQVDVHEGGVEVVAVPGPLDGVGVEGLDEGVAQFGEDGVEPAAGVLGAGFRP
jgi:hypothetical protein